jgi:hypothetical protein
MELVADLSTGGVVLCNPDDLERFSVQAVLAQSGEPQGEGDLGALAAALSVHDAGTVDPTGHVSIPVAVVRRMAGDAAASDGGPVGPEWESAFAAMLEQAANQGWITDDGSIRAHIEWVSA